MLMPLDGLAGLVCAHLLSSPKGYTMCNRGKGAAPMGFNRPSGEVCRCLSKQLQSPAICLLPTSKVPRLTVQHPYHPVDLINKKVRLATGGVSNC